MSSKQVTFIVLMSTSVWALAKTVTSAPFITFKVFHTTTIYEGLKQCDKLPWAWRTSVSCRKLSETPFMTLLYFWIPFYSCCPFPLHRGYPRCMRSFKSQREDVRKECENVTTRTACKANVYIWFAYLREHIEWAWILNMERQVPLR